MGTSDTPTVGIVGAGAMGRGIAQVAATGGCKVLLHDARSDATDEALTFIGGMVDRAAEKERRVELFGRQVLRRMMHAGITRGWTAWHELWRAKVHAYGALRRSAQRLKTWELRAGFEAWVAELEAQYAGIELSELRKAPESLKNELRSLQPSPGRRR